MDKGSLSSCAITFSTIAASDFIPKTISSLVAELTVAASTPDKPGFFIPKTFLFKKVAIFAAETYLTGNTIISCFEKAALSLLVFAITTNVLFCV